MGCCHVAVEKKKKEPKEFSFNAVSGCEFTFEMRVSREMLEHESKVKLLEQNLKNFLIENVRIINKNNIEPIDGGYPVQIQPTPLLDKFWEIAILYSERYYEYCYSLIGAPIDRGGAVNQEQPVYVHQHRDLLPNYDLNIMEYEHRNTIWVQKADLAYMIQETFNFIKPKMSSKVILLQNHVEATIIFIKSKLRKTHNEFLAFKCAIPMDEQAEYILNQIREKLPKNFAYIVRKRFCLDVKLSNEYVEEYARFMTLLALTRETISPSHEVDQVWHTHMIFTSHYRNFCRSTYARIIHHQPYIGGAEDDACHQEQYEKCVELYELYFHHKPPLHLWPSVEVRFEPKRTLGAWINLYRLVFAVIRMIHKMTFDKSLEQDEGKITKSILNAYLQWKGENLLNSIIDCSSTFPTLFNSVWVAGVTSYEKFKATKPIFTEYTMNKQRSQTLGTVLTQRKVYDKQLMELYQAGIQTTVQYDQSSYKYLNEMFETGEDGFELSADDP